MSYKLYAPSFRAKQCSGREETFNWQRGSCFRSDQGQSLFCTSLPWPRSEKVNETRAVKATTSWPLRTFPYTASVSTSPAFYTDFRSRWTLWGTKALEMYQNKTIIICSHWNRLASSTSELKRRTVVSMLKKKWGGEISNLLCHWWVFFLEFNNTNCSLKLLWQHHHKGKLIKARTIF